MESLIWQLDATNISVNQLQKQQQKQLQQNNERRRLWYLNINKKKRRKIDKSHMPDNLTKQRNNESPSQQCEQLKWNNEIEWPLLHRDWFINI